jgi:Methyltransferase domain
MNPLEYPICFKTPRRLTSISGWRQHLPFAMFLVQLMGPRLIVELGTYQGDSYCAFCQAVKEMGLNCMCFAIDTWEGDAHAGEYGPDVLTDLRSHHDLLYGSFSTLVQSTFDSAVARFEDSTVDLLHIDGYHTYEAVRHDFNSWKGKLSSKNVTLFHDINVRERDFGVWQFWEEVKKDYPHFEFFHGCGLGVLAVGSEQCPEFARWLEATQERGVAMRSFFSALGERVDLVVAKSAVEEQSKLKDQEIARLQAFSDAVRKTWAYRFYGKLIRPFKKYVKEDVDCKLQLNHHSHQSHQEHDLR